MAPIDRRGFLVAASGATAAVLGLRPARAAFAASGPGAAAPALAARRAAIFRALVATLADTPDGRFTAVSAAGAEARLARWYAGQAAAERRRVDAVLDALGRRAVPGYRTLARSAAARPRPATAARAAALAAAVDLAAMVCEPPPAEDERPPAPALELPR